MITLLRTNFCGNSIVCGVSGEKYRANEGTMFCSDDHLYWGEGRCEFAAKRIEECLERCWNNWMEDHVNWRCPQFAE